MVVIEIGRRCISILFFPVKRGKVCNISIIIVGVLSLALRDEARSFHWGYYVGRLCWTKG